MWSELFSDEASSTVLIVDLDDSLLRTDTLYEQILKFAKARPWSLPMLVMWALLGKVRLKARLSNEISLDPARLPYRDSVLDLIRFARSQGRQVYLASATHERICKLIAAHLGLFHGVFGTLEVNLKGSYKLAAVRGRLGAVPFIYVGDSYSDLAMWEQATQAVVVSPSRALEAQVRAFGKPCHVLGERVPLIPVLVKQLRLMQWVKNGLLFIPMLMAHRFVHWLAWRQVAFGAISFSLLASAVYVMNDLMDVDADRQHQSKKRRPFAAGSLPLKLGFVLLPVLMVLACGLSWHLGFNFGRLLIVYFVLNIAYSLYLKEIIIVDTVILAGFYTLRILAGGSAGTVYVSPWLLSFSIFFFFGLAMLKRYTELLRSKGQATIDGRGYVFNDKQPVFVIGTASSLIAILIFVQYLSSDSVRSLYSQPDRLWLVTPVMLYWTARLWVLANRGDVHDDPVVFAVKDQVSWFVLLAVACSLAFAL